LDISTDAIIDAANSLPNSTLASHADLIRDPSD